DDPNHIFTNTIATVNAQSDSDHNVFVGVSNGASHGGYSLGLVDRPPTAAEWAMPGLKNMQLWAVGYAGSASSSFNAPQLIWMVTANQISCNDAADLAVGIFIDWAHATGMNEQDRFHNPVDNAGGNDIDSNGNTYNPLPDHPGQTQTIPDGVVDANDFFYFTDAYIAYYTSHIENPYADLTAQGTINGGSFLTFLSEYVYYFTNLRNDNLMLKNLGNS